MVPLASLKSVRSNVLSKDQSFADKHLCKAAATREKEFLMIGKNDRVDLISINLHGLDNNIDLSVKRKGKLFSLDKSDEISSIFHVIHCNGLLALLCDSRNTSIVVWNPYWGETRWIECKYNYRRFEWFAFGYDKSCGSHKILRIFDDKFEIYDLSSNSWRFLNATLDQNIGVCYKSGVSLNGDTYWFARDKEELGKDFLVCFDFKCERFGPRLPLAFDSGIECNLSLSSVKEEQLAVLSAHWDGFVVDIWVTNKVEPDAVSWSKFFKFEMIRLPKYFQCGNFLIDEEKKVAVVFDHDLKAYIIGESGYFRKVDLPCPLVCSYVPSCVQIKYKKNRSWITCISLNKISQ